MSHCEIHHTQHEAVVTCTIANRSKVTVEVILVTVIIHLVIPLLHKAKILITTQKQENVKRKIEMLNRQERWPLLKFTPLVNHVWAMPTSVYDLPMSCPFINSFALHTAEM